MTSILLAGAYGQRNPGDEALLEAFLHALPDVEVIATSSRPEATRVEHGCTAVATRDLAAVARALGQSDALVIGGGTVFKTLHASSGRTPHDLLRKTRMLVRLARTLGKPVAMVGVGAGALADRTARVNATALVRAADLLVLRDEESAHVLAAAGAPTPLRVGADPAWLLVDGPPATRGPVDGPVTVALSHLAGGPSLGDWLIEVVTAIRTAGHRVELQPWQVGFGDTDDLDLARRILTRHPDVVLAPAPLDLADASSRFAGSRAVLALRFHALLAATAVGIPTVAVGHEAKLTALARRLEQPSVSPMATPNQVVGALADAAPPSASAARGEMALAEDGFRLLRLVLSGGHSDDHEEAPGLRLCPSPWDVPAGAWRRGAVWQ